jgi:CheY-like chemotaxis protein
MEQINLVYIVEDDAIASYVIKRIADDHPLIRQSIVFRDARLALESICHLKENGLSMPDLLLLDINMPVMDGWQFLDALSSVKNSKSTSVFIVTSSIDPCDMEKAKEYHEVLGYYLKPFTYDKLDEIVAKYQKN